MQDWHLPGELTDNILDHLHEDSHTLRTCAFVCRAWLPTSLFHLFSTITCDVDSDSKNVRALLSWSSTALLASTHVRKLVIRGLKSDSIRGHDLPIPDIAALISRFANLQRLTIRGPCVNLVPATTAWQPHPAHESSGRALKQLSILRCKTELRHGMTAVYQLLRMFTDIDELHFVDVACSYNPAAPLHAPFDTLPSRLQVRRLHVHNENDSDRFTGYLAILHLFLASRWPLSELDVVFPRVPNGSVGLSLDDLVRSCSATLTDLRVNVSPSMLVPAMSYMSSPRDLAREWDTPALRGCKALETLRLDLLSISDIGDPTLQRTVDAASDEMLHANAALVRAAAPQQSVRAVHLGVFHFGSWDARVAQRLAALASWARLDDALSGLRHLRRVACVVSTDGGLDLDAQLAELEARPEEDVPALGHANRQGEEEYAGILRQGLRGVHSAGLLSIAFVYSS